MRSARLVKLADIAGAMTLEALRGSFVPFDPRLQAVRPHPGQIATADNLRRLLQESEVNLSHKDCGKIQDSYTLRCIPQVHGGVREALTFVEAALTRELNAATDNPLVFPDGGDVLSGGNFHGHPVAVALDLLAVALAGLCGFVERRIERLVNPQLSELPAFLVEASGLNSGFMMAQISAASLVAEARAARDFLMRVRHAAHLASGRKEDRLTGELPGKPRDVVVTDGPMIDVQVAGSPAAPFVDPEPEPEPPQTAGMNSAMPHATNRSPAMVMSKRRRLRQWSPRTRTKSRNREREPEKSRRKTPLAFGEAQ